MKILVVGLGLIGGSTAKALRRAGECVDGKDRPEVERATLEEGAICAICRDMSEYDIVIIALPPDAAMQLLKEGKFKDGAIVADFCGVKGVLEKQMLSRPHNFRYVGCHPMAGREVSGFSNSLETLFDGASMIIVKNEQTDENAVSVLHELYKKIGFTTFRICSAQEHDRKIAYTSQLAHIVSNAYVKSPTANGFSGFTGGSFQDMTRIAGVDEDVWTRLYFLNTEAVRGELALLISHLQQYLFALDNEDETRLKELLKEGRLRKDELDKERKIL